MLSRCSVSMTSMFHIACNRSSTDARENLSATFRKISDGIAAFGKASFPAKMVIASGRVPELAEVQVNVVGKAGERYLVVAGYVEAKLAQAEIEAGLCTAIQDGPMVTVPDLVD